MRATELDGGGEEEAIPPGVGGEEMNFSCESGFGWADGLSAELREIIHYAEDSFSIRIPFFLEKDARHFIENLEVGLSSASRDECPDPRLGHL